MLYLYIAINPAKIDSRTGKPYQILETINEQESKQINEHYSKFQNQIKETDMPNMNALLNMYDDFKSNKYQFNILSKLKSDIIQID